MRTKTINNVAGKPVEIPEDDYDQLEAAAKTFLGARALPYFRIHDAVSFAYCYASTVVGHMQITKEMEDIGSQASETTPPAALEENSLSPEEDEEPIDTEEEERKEKASKKGKKAGA